MKYIKYISMLMVALAMSFMATSCNDETREMEVVDRLFRPVNIVVSASGTTVSATWAAIEGATGYTAELYVREKVEVESEGETTDYENKVLVARDEQVITNSWSVSGLDYDTQYYFRVKANGATEIRNSHFSDFESIKTPAETQVLKVVIDDPKAGNVTFNWMAGYDLSYIRLTGPDGSETNYPINDGDGSFAITKLGAGQYKAVAGNSEKEFNTVSFLIPVLYDVIAEEITFDSVTIRWAPDGNISTLELVNAVTKEEKSYPANINGVLEIPAAELGYFQTWQATLIYADGSLSNTVTFTTLDQMPEGVITVSTAEELKSAIETAANGAIIALNPGEYHMQSPDDSGNLQYVGITLSKSVTLMAATGSMPLVMAKQFNIVAATELELIRMEGIEFAGYDEHDSGATDTYLFNLDAGSAACLKRLEIENCKIHGISNSLIRADRNKAYTVLNILINNNLMWNMNGKQAYISTYNATDGTPAESITFTNNTITGLSCKSGNQRPFGWLASSSIVVNISNNTFYDCQNGTANFFHARGSVDGGWGTVTIKGNIIYSKPADAEKKPNKAPEFGSGATPVIENNVLPFPWGSYNSTTGVLTTDDWSAYGTITADPGFVDAANLDFTPTNETVINAAAGDPRWLK
ncbi:MAG: DUF5123 domain-containing protein [Rikenellaceae bacterium]|nr:DUF5123 domain-containing protein [Rikenellaceae bacterium]